MQRGRKGREITRTKIGSRRGFSMLELVIVVAIMVVITALATPYFLNMVSSNKLRSALSRTSGMLQQARMQAARTNKTVEIKTATANSTTLGYADFDGDAVWDSTEPSVMLAHEVTIGSSGHPGDATSGLGFTAQSGTGVMPKFNSRGLPCVTSGAMCQNFDGTNQVGYVIYFQSTNSYGAPRWGAVTITPAGRIRTWLWSGSAYIGQ